VRYISTILRQDAIAEWQKTRQKEKLVKKGKNVGGRPKMLGFENTVDDNILTYRDKQRQKVCL